MFKIQPISSFNIGWWDGRLPIAAFRFGLIGSWDTSGVTDMSFLLSEANQYFDVNIEAWDVSNERNVPWCSQIQSAIEWMGMFFNTYHFNQLLDPWDIFNVVHVL
jgi:hypothetical protein